MSRTRTRLSTAPPWGRAPGPFQRKDQPVTSAGRHPGNDIFLDDVTVSRRHAEFRLMNGEFRVVNVGSLNDTYVNGEPVHWAVLANDEIQIGKFRLVFLVSP
jgi:pSer/pThr/pTyr-binding forkhead associated (FHA) protein